MRIYLVVILISMSIGSGAATQAKRYQDAAQTALQSQLSKEGKECAEAANTYEQNLCLDKAESRTEHDFDVFYQNLLALLNGESADQQKLKEAQAQWTQYKDKTCDAIDALYKGGTIRSLAVMRCEIEITRSRMRDLDYLYETILHH
jgi:uncharacterized protein YecT (DUF1311 family)